MELAPITLKEANEFVRLHHRHHGPVVGHKFSVAVVREGNIVGVGICGRPVARMLDDGKTLEITRVCIGGYDGDTPEDYDEHIVSTRRSFRCHECKRVMPAGEKHEAVTGHWEDGANTYRFCLWCSEIQKVFSCGEGRAFGSLWDEMQEFVFPELTTANKCFQRLSAEAKGFVMQRWNEWKFGKERP